MNIRKMLTCALCGAMALSGLPHINTVHAEETELVNVALGKEVTASAITSIENDAWSCPPQNESLMGIGRHSLSGTAEMSNQSRK